MRAAGWMASLALLGPAGWQAQSAEAPSHDGFRFRSADGANELSIGGLFQVLFGVFDGDRDPSADFELKRMRPELAGRLADALEFRLEPNFSEQDVELEEAWLGTRIGQGDALLMIGRMKAPFNLEEVRSRRYIDFPRFSIVNQFAPAEDHGLFLNGTSASGLLEYGAAVYNGTGSSDTNSSKDVALRWMIHPFVARAGSALENLQLGLAGTLGVEEEDVGGETIQNEVGLPVVRFANGLELDGTRNRVGLEGAWFAGPWFAQGEFVAVAQEMQAAGSEAEIAFRGGYLSVSRVLTGESKSFKGIVPDEPYDFRGLEGRGAWVLAARLSELDLDSDLAAPGFAEPGTFTDRIRTASLALNWIPNVNAIVRSAVVFTFYDDEVLLDEGAAKREAALLLEFQLHF